jgi:hypothetical protein
MNFGTNKQRRGGQKLFLGGSGAWQSRPRTARTLFKKDVQHWREQNKYGWIISANQNLSTKRTVKNILDWMKKQGAFIENTLNRSSAITTANSLIRKVTQIL